MHIPSIPLQLLTGQGVNCTYIYSSLDQTARKINIAMFSHGKCPVLLVTDVAARGLDIPMLDNVINYSFPAKAKLFLHRVGGSQGWAVGAYPSQLAVLPQEPSLWVTPVNGAVNAAQAGGSWEWNCSSSLIGLLGARPSQGRQGQWWLPSHSCLQAL